jgi:hypothetical protein
MTIAGRAVISITCAMSVAWVIMQAQPWLARSKFPPPWVPRTVLWLPLHGPTLETEFAQGVQSDREPLFAAGGIHLGNGENSLRLERPGGFPAVADESVSLLVEYSPWHQVRLEHKRPDQDELFGIFWLGEPAHPRTPRHSVWLDSKGGRLHASIHSSGLGPVEPDDGKHYGGWYKIPGWTQLAPWRAHLVSVVHHGLTSEYRLYLNGEKVIEFPLEGSVAPAAPLLTIGHNFFPDNGLNGRYSEFMYFDHALEESDVSELYTRLRAAAY